VPIVPRRILFATILLSLLGGSACLGEPSATQGSPTECTTVADCPAGMICQGASPNTRGVCIAPELGHIEPKMAYDTPGRGMIGTVYGQPMIRRQPPRGVSADQAGGTWDTANAIYYPPRGGGWRYQPGPDRGFNGTWIFDPALKNPSPGADQVGSPAR
jgi:hypothetical protein